MIKNYGGHLRMEAFANISSSLCEKLTEKIADLRKTGDYSSEAVSKCGVTEVIRAHTNMDVKFQVTKGISWNAFAVYPSVDNNHPFLRKRWGGFLYHSDTGAALTAKGPVEGSVDRRKYQVHGCFKEMECTVAIAHDLISNKDFTNEEITEIILHEVGHHFTYFEYLGNFVDESWIISNAARIVASDAPVETKRKVLTRAKESLGIDVLDTEEVLNTNKLIAEKNTELVLVSRTALNTRNNSDKPDYDLRNCEQLADAFVAYHGGGRGLASALVKFDKKGWGIASRNSFVYLVVELIKTAVTLLSLWYAPFYSIIILLLMIPSSKIYDPPEMRLKTLKQQLISSMRQTKNTEERKRITEQINAINLLMKELDDKRTFYEIIYENISPTGRRRANEQRRAEEIKDILFNELIVKANEIRSLA